MLRALAILALTWVATGCDEALQSKSGNQVRVIQGRASAGPIRSADITAYSLWPDGSRRAVISQAMTGATGLFTLTIPGHSGPLEIVVTHGYYLEEATSVLITLMNVELRARVADIASAVTEISVTPLTEIAVSRTDQLILDGQTLENAIQIANSKVSLASGLIDILKAPADPGGVLTDPNSDASKYAAILAGISQEATDNGQTSLALTQTLANDFTDGKFDGSTWPSLGAAINKFINSAANSAGFTSASETVLISQP